nr:hypothetical protein [Tanacetum cinerariifolium]
MVAFLSKSNASAGFDQIVDFLNAQVIQYALMVNPTIYVSRIKKFWATASIKKANGVFKLRALIDGKRVVVTEDVIRQALHLDDADCVECRKFNFSKYIFDSMVRNVDSPTKFLIVGKGFSRAETPLFVSMLVQPQAKVEEVDVEVLAAPTQPSPTIKPSPPPQDPITTHPQVQPAPPSSPLQEQPTTTSESFMTLLNNLMETYTTLSQRD